MKQKILVEAIKEFRKERNGKGMHTNFLLVLQTVLERDIPFEYSPADFIHELAIEVNRRAEYEKVSVNTNIPEED